MRQLTRSAGRGFTLIELMISIAIISIVAAIAFPSYTQYTVRARRASAGACLAQQAMFMERVYTNNMRYDQNGGVATTLAPTVCATDLTNIYTFGFASGQPTTTTFTVVATAQGNQASKDADCGNLTMDQAGVKGRTGTVASIATCWR
jgi:type IV pilus assembly protein PilE